MATMAEQPNFSIKSDDRFFLISAFCMMAVIIAGFSLQLAMGRSSFASPPLVHAHAFVFMGWVGIYVLQNVFAVTGNRAMHKRLGWLAAGWIVAMLVLGCMVTVRLVQQGHVPFFFLPQQFLVFDPMTLFTFAGLTWGAIIMRHRTDWHRRLHFCGMSMLLGPGVGRLIPMPLLIPYAFETAFAATMLFPVAGVIADLRRSGRVHPAWLWGIATMLASLLLIDLVTYGPIGDSLYQAVAAGTPGASVPGLAFPPPPGP